MAIERDNPVGIRAAFEVGPNEALLEQIKELHGRIKAAESDRANWLEKQRRLMSQRRGIRTPKNVPWVGANNDNWPVTDGVIRRWKPTIFSLVLDSDPVAYFWPKRPDHVEASNLAQQFWHWEFFQIERVVETVYKLVDFVALHGFAYTHEGWDYHVERKSRVVESSQLFPGGIEASLDRFNADLEAQNQQLMAAQAQGQAPADMQTQPPMAPDEFVRATLQEEYKIGGSQKEEEQLSAAVNALLQGAQYVTIYYLCVVRDKLAWDAISPLDVVVPTRGSDPEKGDFIALAFRYTHDELRRLARDGVFNQDALNKILEHNQGRQGGRIEAEPFDGRHGSGRTGMENDLDSIEGVQRRVGTGVDEPVREIVWKVYCKLDIDGDFINEKCILWYHPATSTNLALQEYPFPFEEWPVTVYQFEHLDDRPYSPRGIAELLSTFQKNVNRLHNARLDAIQITLSPMFRVRSISGEINRNLKFRPGAQVPVTVPDDFTAVPVDVKPLFQFLQEENITKSLAEQYIGVFDSSVLNDTAQERRTATEVQAVTANMTNVSQADARLFQCSFARSTRKLWKLWREFGSDEVFFRVTGENQPRFIKKSEIDLDFDIEPAGTPASTNKVVALNRAREAVQFGLTDQSGVIDKAALWRHYFEILDRNLAKLIVRSPEQALAAQTVLQAAGVATGRTPEAAPPPAF